MNEFKKWLEEFDKKDLQEQINYIIKNKYDNGEENGRKEERNRRTNNSN